jgi:hypothetical protein
MPSIYLSSFNRIGCKLAENERSECAIVDYLIISRVTRGTEQRAASCIKTAFRVVQQEA